MEAEILHIAGLLQHVATFQEVAKGFRFNDCSILLRLKLESGTQITKRQREDAREAGDVLKLPAGGDRLNQACVEEHSNDLYLILVLLWYLALRGQFPRDAHALYCSKSRGASLIPFFVFAKSRVD